jgi:hypothetical protein
MSKDSSGGPKGRPGRPRAEHAALGLTSGEVAKQLGCSRGNVDRLRKCGRLAARRDGAGKWRYRPSDVAETARSLGRPARTSGAVAAKLYRYFSEPGFRGSPDQFSRIVQETEEDPDVVVMLWNKFRAGAGSPEAEQEARAVARANSEYAAEIAAMNEDRRQRRSKLYDDVPPSSRTGT